MKLPDSILRKGAAALAVLIDPDKYNAELVPLASHANVSCFFVGGSVIRTGDLAATVRSIRSQSNIPVILFPGDETQLTAEADGVMLPWLLSGRNADYLIGKQVMMAPKIRQMQLPVFSAGYILVEGQRVSATQTVTGTTPLSDVTAIRDTAITAETMGMSAVYLEAGSGADTAVAAHVIRIVRQSIRLPLIVGGGIDSAAKARDAVSAGADLVVIGNALEKNVHLLAELGSIFR